MNEDEINKIVAIHSNFTIKDNSRGGPHTFTGMNGNNSFTFYSWEKPSLKTHRYLINKNFVLFKKVFGLSLGNKIELVLEQNFASPFLNQKDKVTIQITYKKKIYVANLIRKPDNLISKFYKNSEISGQEIITNFWTAEIIAEDLKLVHLTEEDIEEISNSLFFELEVNCNSGFFELVMHATKYTFMECPSLIERDMFLPTKFEYKHSKYDEDLLDYFKFSQKINYTPFRFICYYHILEYYMEKSLIDELTDELKNLIANDEINNKTNDQLTHYIKNTHLKFRSSSGTTNLKQVLLLHAQLDEVILKINNDHFFKDHFKSDIILPDGKEIKLLKLNLNDKTKFANSLANRIYKIRNSIVHSNSDTLRGNNSSFNPTDANLSILGLEISLMKLLAINVIKSNRIN